jgi:hypothetical protein
MGFYPKDIFPGRISTMKNPKSARNNPINNPPSYQTRFIDRYKTAPSCETLKRLHQEPDPGNQPGDLEAAGLDHDQQLKARKYAMAYKADLGRSYSHEFLRYLSDLSYSVLGEWLQENAPEEIQDLFQDVIILNRDVAAFEGPGKPSDFYFSGLTETVSQVSQLIPRLGGKFEEFTEF